MPTDSPDIDVSDLENRLKELRDLMQKEDPTDAIRACDRLNRDYPVSGHGWSIASQLALRIDDADVALRAISYALDVDPERPAWLLQKASCLMQTGRLPDARALAARMSTRLYPNAALSAAVGLLLSQLNMYAEARVLFEEAIRQQPSEAGHYYNLATAQRYLGELESAEANLSKTIELNPADVDGLVLRSILRQQSADNNHVAELKRALDRPNNLPREVAQICYATAKELEDLGEYAESFRYLSQGAGVRRQHLDYAVEEDVATMTQIQSTFDKKRFADASPGHVDASPIFVFGLPRTGTTLVERVLGAHSVVAAAGELSNFAQQLSSVAQGTFSTPIRTREQLVAASAQLDAAELGRVYIKSCASFVGDSVHFVDKMPMNFLYAGLIHLALPKARIVHVVRDPMDTCYAAYKTLFEGAYPYSYDLRELANYYVAYHRLMEHWEQMIPGVMHRVRYEELTTDTHARIERLLDYCDLSWEDECFEFHNFSGYAMPASGATTRKPISRDSIGIWKSFEKELQPITEILTEAGIEIN